MVWPVDSYSLIDLALIAYLTDSTLRALSGNYHLRVLHLNRCRSVGVWFDNVSIDIQFECSRICRLITDDGLLCLAKGCQFLQTVNIRWCENITDQVDVVSRYSYSDHDFRLCRASLILRVCVAFAHCWQDTSSFCPITLYILCRVRSHF